MRFSASRQSEVLRTYSVTPGINLVHSGGMNRVKFRSVIRHSKLLALASALQIKHDIDRPKSQQFKFNKILYIYKKCATGILYIRTG